MVKQYIANSLEDKEIERLKQEKLKKRELKEQKKKEVLAKEKQKLSFLDDEEDIGLIIPKKSKIHPLLTFTFTL